MPRGDRTGPNGLGSKTGRGAGLCAGNNEPGCATVGGRGAGKGCKTGGRGLGRGLNQGAGRGLNQGERRGMGSNTSTASSSNLDLSKKAQDLEAQIAEIKQQLNERS